MRSVELAIFVGIPASGKSTFYRRRMSKQYAHVSLDNWRGKGNVRHKERLAITEGLSRALAGEDQLLGVAVDNTNTTRQTRRRYFDLAGEFQQTHPGSVVKMVAYFFDADLDGCLDRNSKRPSDAPPGEPYYVPPEAIINFRTRLDPPTRDEGFTEIIIVRVTDDDFQVQKLA